MKKAVILSALTVFLVGCDSPDPVQKPHSVDGILVNTPSGSVCIRVTGGGCNGCVAYLETWEPVDGQCFKLKKSE